MKRFKDAMWGTLLALSLTLATAWAQDAPPPPEEKPSPSIQQDGPPPPPDDQSATAQADQPEPPSRVARLQYMSGSVSIQPQGTGDWAAGVINRPLTSSDNIWTDKDSRAELNVGSGLIRMNSESSLTLTSVSDNTTQLELHQGSLSLRVRNLAQGETYEIDTPNTAFTVQTAGEYRVDVDSNGNSSEVTVWQGEGQASSNGSSVTIKAGEQEQFGDGNTATGEVAQAPAPDSFDNWCHGRDQREGHSVSARYVSPDVIGSQDLDEYGIWRDTPDYGPVWIPSAVPGDWAPYHDGHWVWVSPWGWTWIDDEPWGFAPFHYGRWIYGDGYWGWAPGPYWGRPFYAPALVAWFGGPRWGGDFGFGFRGGIGWCALGWGEPFFPWYHAGFGYFNRINIYNTRITNINRFRDGFGRPGFGGGFHYANLRAPGGPIAVPQRALTNSLSVHGMAVQMSANQFAGASLGGRVPVNPSRISRLGATAGRAAAVPPSRAFSRATVSRSGMTGNGRTASRGVARAGSFARSNGGATTARNTMARQSAGPENSGSARYVPRPPASMHGSNSGMAESRPSQQMRSAPGAFSRGYSAPGRSYAPGGQRTAQGFGRGSSNYVPRPSGPVRSSDYASNGYRGGYSSRGYSSPSYSSRDSYGASRSYGNSSRYSSPSRSYSSQPSYRSYSGPSYRSYSAPPSYRGYSAPSSRGYSGRSYSAPSYHGSSGYSGGGHSSGGGRGGRR